MFSSAMMVIGHGGQRGSRTCDLEASTRLSLVPNFHQVACMSVDFDMGNEQLKSIWSVHGK